jgi:hypothetical protein
LRLGVYELEDEVGRGGAGVVYRGRAPNGQRVAVKVLISREPAILERFEREARIQASLGASSGFVPVLDARVVEGRAFLVMPLVEGGSLRDRFERGPFPAALVQELGRTLASALGEAHERGVVHRDLKPENVLFSRDGKPLIADLGLAKHFDGSTGALSLSKSGALVGTAGYMAPEQIENARSAGPPADVFSLGAVLYEALAGTPPFAGTSVLEILASITSGEHEPLGSRCPDAPVRLVAAIERAISRDPRERPQHGRAFAGALEAASARPRRARWPLALGALILVAAGGAGGFLLGRDGSDPGRGPAPPAPTAPSRPPAPPAPPRPKRSFPPECQGFLATRHATLTGFGGAYRWHHRDGVEHVAISEGGNVVVSVDRGQKLRAWSAPLGTQLWSQELPYLPDGIAISWDARRVLGVSGGTGLVEVRDARTGELEWSRTEPWLKGARRVAFTEDTRFQASGDEEVLGWGDAETKVLDSAHVLQGPRVVAVNLSPGEKRVAILDVSGAIEVRTADGTDVVATGRDPASSRCDHILYTGDGSVLATWSSRSGEIVLHDAATIALRDRIATGKPIVELALLDATTAFVLDGEDGALARWDLAAKRKAQDLVPRRAAAFAATNRGRSAVVARGRVLTLVDLEHTPGVLAPVIDTAPFLGVLGDGRVVGGGEGGVVHVVGLEASAVGFAMDLAHGPIGPVAVSRDERVVAGTFNGTLLELDVAAGSARPLCQLNAALTALAVNRDGTVAAGDRDGELTLFELAKGGTTGAPRSPFGDDGINGLDWTPDGSKLVAVSQSGKVATIPGSLASFASRRAAGVGVACAPKGGRALVVGREGVALLWDLEKNSEIAPLPCPEVVLAGVWLDGSHVAVSGRDGTIRLVDVETRREIDRIDLSSSDDETMALACRGGDLHAWTMRGVVLRFALQLP